MKTYYKQLDRMTIEYFYDKSIKLWTFVLVGEDDMLIADAIYSTNKKDIENMSISSFILYEQY